MLNTLFSFIVQEFFLELANAKKLLENSIFQRTSSFLIEIRWEFEVFQGGCLSLKGTLGIAGTFEGISCYLNGS